MGNALIIISNRVGTQLRLGGGHSHRQHGLRLLKARAAKLNPARRNKLRPRSMPRSIPEVNAEVNRSSCTVSFGSAGVGGRNHRLGVADPPPRSTWSMAIGPPPKKIRAKARAAAARGNSNPG